MLVVQQQQRVRTEVGKFMLFVVSSRVQFIFGTHHERLVVINVVAVQKLDAEAAG
jgi:hypothetical protein